MSLGTHRYITLAVEEIVQEVIISKPNNRKRWDEMTYYFVPPGYNTAGEHERVLVSVNKHISNARNVGGARTNIRIRMCCLNQSCLGLSYYLSNCSRVYHIPNRHIKIVSHSDIYNDLRGDKSG